MSEAQWLAKALKLGPGCAQPRDAANVKLKIKIETLCKQKSSLEHFFFITLF